MRNSADKKQHERPFCDCSCWVCIIVALMLGGLRSLEAQTDVPGSTSSFAATQVEVTPYIWGMHINSDDQLGQTSLNSNLPLSRILRSVKGLGELEVVAKERNFFVSGDGIYADLKVEPKTPIPNLDHIKLQAGFVTLAGGYSFGPYLVAGEGRKAAYMSVQPFGGASYTDIAVTAISTGGTNILRVAQEWWMPTAGARINLRRGQYVVRLDGDFSAFGNHQNGEQALGAIGYQLNKPRAGSPILQLGYRYLYEKKQPNAEEALRLKLQGPVFFVTFHLR